MRRLTRERGVLLIFDEVLSAFRMAAGGAQEYLKITPDLCTLGKAVGGGQALSAFGGRRDIMDRLMPIGDCQHSGTYNGHLVAVAAALAAVTAYKQPGFYEHIFQIADRLYVGLGRIFDKHGIPARVQGLGARFGIYFGVTEPVRNYRDAVRHHRDQMLRFVKSAIDTRRLLSRLRRRRLPSRVLCGNDLADVNEILSRLDDAVGKME